ncbi:MAG TPA: SHOCT domain-containing protein [Flavobacteriales bacterium]|nr:SHOCT domain-containing protein [Flavobacteriales bacterium]
MSNKKTSVVRDDEKVILENEDVLITDKRFEMKGLNTKMAQVSSFIAGEKKIGVWGWTKAILSVTIVWLISDAVFLFGHEGASWAIWAVGIYLMFRFLKTSSIAYVTLDSGDVFEFNPTSVFGRDWGDTDVESKINLAIVESKDEESTSNNLEDELNSLKELLEKKLITQDEFDIKRKKLIDL